MRTSKNVPPDHWGQRYDCGCVEGWCWCEKHKQIDTNDPSSRLRWTKSMQEREAAS